MRDDELDREVLEKGAQGRLKVYSKYGVGLDKIDLVRQKNWNSSDKLSWSESNAVAEHVLSNDFFVFQEHSFDPRNHFSRRLEKTFRQ